MKKICTFAAVLAVILLFTGTSFATGLLTEDFSYTAGTVLSANGWAAHSGSGGIFVTTSGLTYSGYQGSGVGNAVTVNGVTTEDDNKTLSTAVTTGTVYASAMINITSQASTVGDYFFHFGTGPTTFQGKLFTRADAVSGFDFGVSKAASTGTNITWSSAKSFGTTYLVVLKYTFVAGTSNDQVDVFINPTPGGSEPAATITSTDNLTGTDLTSAAGIYLRQSSTTTMPVAIIDGIKVGTTWADVMVSSSPSLSAAPSSITGLTYITGAGPSASQSYTLSGANLTGFPGDITVSASTNFEVSKDNSTWSATSVTVPYTSATLSAPVYVRLKSGLAVASYGPENIANAGGGATTLNVPASGTVEVTTQLNVSAPAITGLNYYFGSGPSAQQSYNLSGSSLTGFPGVITVTAPANFEVSKTSGSGFASSVTVNYTSATLASTPIYVRLVSGLANGVYGPANVTNAGGGAATENVAVSGSVVTQTITAASYNDISLSYVTGFGPSGNKDYNLTGSNLFPLAGNITITAPSNFELSTDGGATFSGSGSVAYTAGSLASTHIFVRLVAGLAINTYGPGTLSFAGGGAATQNITLNGFVGAGGLLFSDNFSYPAGSSPADSLVGNGGWATTGTLWTNPPQVTTPGLTYTGLAGSGVGNAVTLTGAGEDVNHQYVGVSGTSPALYASAMVNVTSATTAGDYFIHFGDQASFAFWGRTFVKSSGGGFVFGISKYNGVVAWGTTVYNFNQTYLIVLKYNFVAGATNDFCNLYINPTPGGSETAPEILTTNALLADAAGICGVNLRQGSSANAPTVIVDGIKVGQTWALVTPTAGSILTLTAFIEGVTNAGGTAMKNDVWPINVTVELHNSSTYALVEAKSGVLSSAGVGTFTFASAVDATPYYVVVKSANSLETWSATAVSFTSGALSYNFTTAAEQAYGSNMMQKGSKWCIYSGDVSKDASNIIDISDVIAIDNDNTYGVTDNPVTDVNGDGIVDISDVINVDNNNTYGIGRQAPGGAPIAAKHVMRPVLTPKQNIK